MNPTRNVLVFLLVTVPMASACRLGGGETMPVAASPASNPPAGEPKQPNQAAAAEPGAGSQVASGSANDTPPVESPPGQGTSDEMATQMHALATDMAEMGATLQNHGRAMGGKTAKMKATARETDAIDPAKMKELGTRMEAMGDKMRSKGQAMKGDGNAIKAQSPVAGGMPAMDPAQMMDMGTKMMGMGGKMKQMAGGMGGMKPTKMTAMGDQMMGMGGEMGGMGPSMAPKASAPMKTPMGAAAPMGAAPAPAAPAPAAPMPVAAPMQDM